MPIEPRRLAVGLAGFQAADAVACAIPLSLIRNDLDRLRVARPLQRAIPAVKAASVVGLVIGFKRPRLGELTIAALVAYFVAALGFHRRAGDGVMRSAPAAAVMAWAVLAGRAYRPT